MDTNTLQAFLAVAETGSFSLAAEQLFLTQPAVSKRVAALEEELSTRLFERLGRRVLLTEAGETLLPKARHIFLEMAESRRLIANLSKEVSGKLQLAISHHVGLHRLPNMLRDYGVRYPQVEFDLHFMNSETGCEAVSTGDIELAVVTLPEKPFEKLVLSTIWHDPLMFMVSRDHPLTQRKKTISAFQEYPAILPEKGTVTRQLIEKVMDPYGLTLDIGVETNYLETIRMLVSVGLGWSVLPVSMQSEELVRIEIPGVEFIRKLGIVTHRNRSLSRAALAFQEMLMNG
jgi:DNA-binding transcriptional LysR family regulator